MRYSGNSAGASWSWSREDGSEKGNIFANSDGPLDVSVKPGTCTQGSTALAPSRGTSRVGRGTQRQVLWGQAKQRVTRAYVGMHGSWLESIVLDTETTGGLAEEPLLLCVQAVRMALGVVGDVKGWEVAGMG